MRSAVTLIMLLAAWYACDRGARFTVALLTTKEDVGRAPVGHDEPCAPFGTSGPGCRTRRDPKDSALRPRNGHTLIVGIVARISGCADQQEVSLEDQEDHAKQVVVEMYDGPVEYRVIATIGKGEALDRPELEQIEAQLLRGELDLLITEDLGRLVRGAEATRIVGVAVDKGTRVIVVNDNIDTADDSWEQEALRASGEHVGHNVHTSRRLKQKLMNRFRRSGAAPGRPIAGYDVPAGAKTYFDWTRQADATPVIREGLRLLRADGDCAAVADYFNAVPWRGGVGFPTGPYCRRRTWDGKMVRRFYANRILGGAPGRGFRHTVKRHGKGRRVSVKNPLGPKFIECPNLAHVDLAELDAVNAELARRNRKRGRRHVGGVDPCLGVARRDTRFPGRCARCSYCGRFGVWGGNGIAGHLMCPGAREWRCWCSVGFDGEMATDRVLGCLRAALDRVDGVDEQFRELVRAARAGVGDLDARRARLRRERDVLEAQKENLQKVMKAVGPDPLVLDGLAGVKAAEARLAVEGRDLDALATRELVVPESAAELRALVAARFKDLAAGSPAFGRQLRKVVTRFDVYLVRLVDGGHPLPAAKIRLALDGITPDGAHVPGLGDLLTAEFTVQLFAPPQRAAIRERVVELAAGKLTQDAIARQLGVTKTAVHDALALDRRMRELGLTSPYVVLDAPPDDYPKLRRHRNPKYRFEPLGGYERPAL